MSRARKTLESLGYEVGDKVFVKPLNAWLTVTSLDPLMGKKDDASPFVKQSPIPIDPKTVFNIINVKHDTLPPRYKFLRRQHRPS